MKKDHKKLIIILTILFFLVIILYSVFTLIYRNGKTAIIIRVAPNSATIKLNDTRVANNTTHWLEPGNYHVVISANEHLETYETDITITNEQLHLYRALTAIDSEGEDFINQHRQEYVTIEGLIGEQLSAAGERIKNQYPLLAKLPINNNLYSISYSYDDNNKPIITIKSEPEYLDTTIARLKTFNVTLSEYNIVFKLNNPFTQTNSSTSSDPTTFISESYNLPSNYIINQGQTFNDYYYTTVYIQDYDRALDYYHYRVLLKKKNDSWTIVSTPQPLLTIYNTKDTDVEILNLVNSY